MTSSSMRAVLALSVALFAATSGEVAIAGNLDELMVPLGAKINEFLADQGRSAVSVSVVSAPKCPISNVGVTQSLTEALAKHQLRVEQDASIGLRVTINERREGGAQLKVTAVNEFGEELHTWIMPTGRIEHEVGLLGKPILAKNPAPQATPSIENEVARAGADAQYGAQVFVDDKPLELELRNGLTYCKVPKGIEYSIILHNDSPYDVAADIEVDGINAFHFSEMRMPDDESTPMYHYFIVPPHQTMRVVGYHKNNKTALKFSTVPAEQSEAHRLGMLSSIGTITVNFRPCWPENEEPPAGIYEAVPIPLAFEAVDKDGGLTEFRLPEQTYSATVTVEEELTRRVTVSKPEERTTTNDGADSASAGEVEEAIGTRRGGEAAVDQKTVERRYGYLAESVTIRYGRQK